MAGSDKDSDPRPIVTLDEVARAVREFDEEMTAGVVLPDGSELRALPPDDAYREKLRTHIETRFAGCVLAK